MTKSLQATTSVPTGDAAFYTVTAIATDFARAYAKLDVAWPTRAKIVGFLMAKTTGTVPRNSCKAVRHATFEIPVSAIGPVEGRGVATPFSPPRCTKGYGVAGPEDFNFLWQGAFDGASFRLNFQPLE